MYLLVLILCQLKRIHEKDTNKYVSNIDTGNND